MENGRVRVIELSQQRAAVPFRPYVRKNDPQSISEAGGQINLAPKSHRRFHACLTSTTEKVNALCARIDEKSPYVFTYRLTTATGQEIWVLDKDEAIYRSDGGVEALEGFVTDHTKRMKAIELLERRVVDRTRKLSALYDILEVASDPSDLNTTITRSLHRVLRAIKGNVGPAEANPCEGCISNRSPLGRALLDHTIGEDVEIETPCRIDVFPDNCVN